MRRILVIGPGGAGKSTFAIQLGGILGLQVVHLDSMYWQPGWIAPAKDKWTSQVQNLINEEEWIIDGNYSGTLRQRIAASDTVIFLDLPRLTCLWRVLTRAWFYRNRTRPDMADGCPEQVTLEFLAWVWNYRRDRRPKVLRLLEEQRKELKVIWLQSQKEVDEFLLNQRDMNNLTDKPKADSSIFLPQPCEREKQR